MIKSKWVCRANGENTSQKPREVSEGDSDKVKIKMCTLPGPGVKFEILEIINTVGIEIRGQDPMWTRL